MVPKLMQRIAFTVCAVVIYRLGMLIPVPGIDPLVLGRLVGYSSVHRFSTIFALGIVPYISAAVLVQLAAIVSKRFRTLQHLGDRGRRLLTGFTDFLALLLAALQAFGLAVALQDMPGVVIETDWTQILLTVATLTGGTMFLIWLAKEITLRGFGNGIGVLLLAESITEIRNGFNETMYSLRQGYLSAGSMAAVAIIIVYVTALVVWVELAQRKIPVRFIQHSASLRALLGQAPHLSFKLNPGGAIIPVTLASWVLGFGVLLASHGPNWLIAIVPQLQPGRPLHLILYGLLIVFFALYYTAFVINPRQMADSLAQHGGAISSMAPGEGLREYIDGVVSRITVIGAAYLAFVCLIPYLLVSFLPLPFTFGGPLLLVLVCAMLDIYRQFQVEAQLTPRG
jgi:preprotein translocase subunit SecY